MPLVAIGIAGASLALGGATAIGAVVAGTATLATTLTAVATIGAVTSAIGAVTGSKALQTAGLVMGAVGGVGALAANAGLLGEGATTESLFGSSQATADQMGGDVAAGMTSSEAGQVTNEAAIDAGLPNSGGDFVNAINSNTSPATAASQTAQAAAAAPPAAAASATPLTGAQTAPAATAAATGGDINETTGTSGLINTASANPAASTGSLPPSQVGVPQGAGAVPTAPGVATPTAAVPTAPTAGAAAAPASTSAWSNIMNFANKNPIVAYSAINAAGSLVSGLFNPVTPAQVSALNSQAAANNATAAQTSQQTANMKQGVPVATRTPANTGLINTAPVKTADVTGLAA